MAKTPKKRTYANILHNLLRINNLAIFLRSSSVYDRHCIYHLRTAS